MITSGAGEGQAGRILEGVLKGGWLEEPGGLGGMSEARTGQGVGGYWRGRVRGLEEPEGRGRWGLEKLE